jgi:hypothetical protein
MLHVLNGDVAAAVFAGAGLPGEVLVWRDLLVEGPVGPDGALTEARVAYLAERFEVDPAAYRRAWQAQEAGLRAAAAQDEVVLWFEQDLFGAVTLWYVLAALARAGAPARLSLVYAEPDEHGGLGRLAPEALAALFAARAPLGAEALALGRRVWEAYSGADPLAAEPLAGNDEAPLPFVRTAVRVHFGRFPSRANGLNEVEATTLGMLKRRPLGFADLFAAVSAQPRVRRHGMGDVQFAACLRGLRPLLEVQGMEVRRAEFGLTPLARDVLAGDADWLDCHELDRWVGGVRLGAGRPLWRWDAARGRLARVTLQ